MKVVGSLLLFTTELEGTQQVRETTSKPKTSLHSTTQYLMLLTDTNCICSFYIVYSRGVLFKRCLSTFVVPYC